MPLSYEDLAETVYTGALTKKNLRRVARYRRGKSWKDVVKLSKSEFISTAGLRFEEVRASLADGLAKIVKIKRRSSWPKFYGHAWKLCWQRLKKFTQWKHRRSV